MTSQGFRRPFGLGCFPTRRMSSRNPRDGAGPSFQFAWYCQDAHQAETAGRIGFTDGLGPGNGAIDERKGLDGGGDLLAYHPKMGR
jgi:hypothetical protein